MRRYSFRNGPVWIRLLVFALGVGQILGTIPIAYAEEASSRVEALAVEAPVPAPQASQVEVNRTAPAAVPVPPAPQFSNPPTDVELARVHVFEEPLIPIGRATTPGENVALARSITTYSQAGGGEDVSALENFLSTNPETPWRPALLTGLGIVYRRTGYFSKALAAWQGAWTSAKVATNARGNAIADRALAELAELSGRLGRYEDLQALFAEIGSRDVHGSAGEKLVQAREGLAMMRVKPGLAFRCGPMALDRIMAYANPHYRPDIRITHAESTMRGTSLVQVQALSQTVGLNLQMAFRAPSVAPIVPAVVHWKAGHFAALVDQRGGRYLLQDPTFGSELWVSRKALDEEASGYVLIPPGALPAGWRSVSVDEGGQVWGKGFASWTNPQNQSCQDPSSGGGGGGCPPNTTCLRMAQYRVHSMLVALNIFDQPVGYTPPRGTPIGFQASYHQREVFQPQVPAFGNLGPKWTYDWLSFVEDDPANLSADVNVYLRLGGQETYNNFNSSTQSYPPHSRSRATVVRTSTSPITYERRLSDGSKEVFAQSDGSPSVPRKVYLTSWSDPQGNTVTLTYNGLKLVGVTDAIGQVTTLSYELPGDPLKITKVTDPFGRFATLEYNAQGQLEKITDVIGIASQFAYGTGDFISSLTTPYGTTRFTTGTGDNLMRWVEATDPIGGVERIEYRQGAPGIAESEPAALVPAGVITFNQYLNARNTFYWDKRASAANSLHNDYTKAVITHWAHDVDPNVSSGIIESQKMPLENRVWYSYPGQTNPGFVSSFTAGPATVARVLDDGSTQLYRYEYNSLGKVTKSIDPVGRETRYTYGTNNTPDPDPATGTGIDLLKVERKNGASYDILQTLTYDTKHRPLTRTDESGQTTTYTYNGQGQIETVTMPPRAGITENRTTTYSYDAYGFLQTLTGPATGLTSSFTYDAYGRLRTATDPEGYTTTYDYDALDRMTKATYPDGTYEEAVYNRLDREKRRDRLGRWTHTFHDALRRIVATRDPLGRTTTRQWCTCGSLDKLIDPNGNAISWARDLQGRVTQESRADGSDVDFVYENTTSRLKQVTDAKSQVVGYEYFADGDLKQVTHTNPQNPTANVSFTYDLVYNRPATMVDGVGTTTYTYHPVTAPPTLGSGRLASVDGPLANDTITYSYDELGRRTGRAVNSVATTQSYDTLGRVASEATPIGTFNYSYVAATARLSSITYPNGQATEYSYLGNLGDHRLQEIHNRLSGGATLSRFQYTFEADGTIKTWTQQADASPARVYELGYDSADQLTSAILKTTDPTPAILKRFAYDYDKAGNRTTEQIDDSAVAATHNNMDELLSEQPGGALRFGGTVNEPATVTVQGKPAQVTADNRFTGSASLPSGTSSVDVRATDPSGNVRTNTYQVSLTGASKSFSYDANGNLISDGSRTFEWDAEDRLLAVTLGTHRSEFAYDGRGRRVRIIEKDGGQVTDDRWLLWCDERICEERDSGGGVVRKRFFDRGLQDDGISYYYAKDHLGSTRELTDSSGAIRARYDYDPYGRVTKTLGDRDTPFRFIGSYFHSPSSLTLTLYRAYDSGMGRWISQDPAGPVDGTNLYGYVQNDPVNFIDPSGLFKIEDRIKKVRTIGIGQVCPPTSGGACTIGATAILLCTCTDNPSCPEEGSKVDTAILRLYGTMYIYSGPWPTLKKTPKDKSVKDAASAEAHEYNVHINPSVAAVIPLIEELESKTFDSRAECEGACRETAAKVNKLFAETLRKTQQQENKGP